MPQHEHRFDPSHKNALIGSERWARWNPPQLLATAGVRAAAIVADIGCGPGFWTIPIADMVGPTGQVIALDVSQELLDALVALKPPAHVRAARGELPTIALPDESVDILWVAFVFHEVEPVPRFVTEMRRVLRRGGTLAVLDWRPDARSTDGPPRHHRLSSDQVRRYIEAGGFVVNDSAWLDDDAYLITAK
jgi:ubiquinone/menaquinone biosynthesis C-methylase UbiE